MSVIRFRSDRLTRWHAVAALVMAGLGVWATWAAWADIYHIASVDEEYSHIFIVPLVAAYLVWVRRGRLRQLRPSLGLVGPVLVAAGWGLGRYGFNFGVQTVWHGGAVLVVLGCVLSVLGKNVIFQFFPAVLVLIFMIPAPGRVRQGVAIPLQKWTAQTAQVAFETVGVEAEVSGCNLSVNGTTVTVAEGCNGLRMVFALILVTFAFAFGMPLKNWVRGLILLASPLAAILCNVVRILPTAWMYAHVSKRAAEDFHDWAGWAMLPVAFAMLYAIVRVMRWAAVPVNRYTLAAQ